MFPWYLEYMHLSSLYTCFISSMHYSLNYWHNAISFLWHSISTNKNSMHFLTYKSIYCFKRVLYSTYNHACWLRMFSFVRISVTYKILLWVWIYLLHSLFMTELYIFQFIPFKCFIIIPFSNWSNSDLSVSLLLCKVTTLCFSFNVCFLLTCLHQNCNFWTSL